MRKHFHKRLLNNHIRFVSTDFAIRILLYQVNYYTDVKQARHNYLLFILKTLSSIKCIKILLLQYVVIDYNQKQKTDE